MTSYARRVPGVTFTMAVTEAFKFPTRDPLRLLALVVILRWQYDGAVDEIGEEWAEAAEVSPGWLTEVAHA